MNQSIVAGTGGAGGSSIYGNGVTPLLAYQGAGTGTNGQNAVGFGAGGGGAACILAVENYAGGDGSDGLVIITEFVE